MLKYQRSVNFLHFQVFQDHILCTIVNILDKTVKFHVFRTITILTYLNQQENCENLPFSGP